MTLLAEMRRLLGEDRALVRAPHEPEEPGTKLNGPVRVRAVWNAYKNVWDAIEGSHRLALANKLGVQVEIIPVKRRDVLPNENPDGTAIVGVEPGFQIVSVGDALDYFDTYGPRPTYELDVVVRSWRDREG